MDRRWALVQGTLADGEGFFLEDGGILVRGGDIEAVGPSEEIRRRCEGDGTEVISVGGRPVFPGFLNAHHHLYSSLTAGIAPRGAVTDFISNLELLWWHLDGVHDEESVYWSALWGLAQGIRAGVTAVIDHHASQSFVRGSLAMEARAFRDAGVRGVLCFETSDRGPGTVEDQLEENIDFFRSVASSDDLRGVMGLHASLTLGEESLRRVARRRPPSMPVHVHCGEDRSDRERCRDWGYLGPVDRLARFGLLDQSSLLVHCLHLDEAEYPLLEELGCWVLANPESNAKNGVGRLDQHRLSRWVLGTDGMTGNMLASLRSAFLLGDPGGDALGLLGEAFFVRGHELARQFFPGVGRLVPGAPADLAVVDYSPVTPLTRENLMGHLVFGAQGAEAFITAVRGKILWREGRFTVFDERELRRGAREAATRLWRRFEERAPGGYRSSL